MGEGEIVFEKNKCAADFFQRNVEEGRKGVWNCQCDQGNGYVVSVGDAGIDLPGDEKEALGFWEDMRKCTEKEKEEFGEMCKEGKKEFSVIARHRLEACCKRVKVGESGKFDCKKIVPDDLDTLETQK